MAVAFRFLPSNCLGRRRLLATMLLLAGGVIVASAQSISPEQLPQVIGQIVYLQGKVDVYRDAKLLDPRNVDVGLQIQSYDLLQTGSDGTAEIDIETPSTPGLNVKVGNDTSFYFDFGILNDRQQTRFEMLGGSLSFKVQHLFRQGDVIVKTAGTAMGVRGTEFEVTAAPDGSHLITCTDGVVVCANGSGPIQEAKPGQVVEQTQSGLRDIAVTPDRLDEFKSEWIKEREAIFQAGAPTFVRSYAVQFANLLPQFENAYQTLVKQSPVFDAWAQRIRQGQTVPLGTTLRERGSVASPLIRMRGIYPQFEQIYFALKLLARYHAEGVGKTQIAGDLSSDSFFGDFANQESKLAGELATVRYFFGLYARNTGFEDDSLMGDAITGGSIFGGSGPPQPASPR